MKRVIERLGEMQMTSAMVEAGCQLMTSALALQSVDKVSLFYAPVFLGAAGVPMLSAIDLDEAPMGWSTSIEQTRGGFLVQGISSGSLGVRSEANMFTGLIEATGKVLSVEERAGTMRIAVEAPGIAERLKTGDSVAVSGVCLTALDIEPGLFHADLAAETVARTSLALLAPGTTVNLELPTPAGAPWADMLCRGTWTGPARWSRSNRSTRQRIASSLTGGWRSRFRRPCAVHGGEGLGGHRGHQPDDCAMGWQEVGVAILPHTYAATNLHRLQAGSPVNLEADVLVKLAAERRPPVSTFELTVDYLVANGY